MGEYIICAAVWYKELLIKNEETAQASRPKNIKTGVVFAGLRHHNAMYTMSAVTGLRDCESGENIQGFLTNYGNFVDRKEAADIALFCGQVGELKYSSTELYSEDLY